MNGRALFHGKTGKFFQPVEVIRHVGVAVGRDASIVVQVDPLLVVGPIERDASRGCRSEPAEFGQDGVILVVDPILGVETNRLVSAVDHGVSPVLLANQAVGKKYAAKVH